MITSLQNARIKTARKLSDRKERYATGLMLVEGVRLLGDAWQSGSRPEVVFFAPELIEKNEGAQALLADLAAHGCECLACTPPVFATLVDTVTPQGVAAVLPLPTLALPAQPTLVLVLDEVRDPGNAGTLLRSAAAAGVGLVVFGPRTVDPFNDKVVRAGMGAHFRIPVRVCATWAQVQEVVGGGTSLYLAEAGAQLAYDQVDWRQTCGLIVGGEARGASDEARDLATPITIPMQAAVESLNAAVAGSIILFEAARQRRTSP